MISSQKINTFTFFKLPSAWWCGVRCRKIDTDLCLVSVRHMWFNQNPFNSMYFAVQAMAAELSTGALVMAAINESGARVSMLVVNNEASFTKKATGKITFTCSNGIAIKETILKSIQTGEGQTLWMTAQGVDQSGDVVSTFKFEWTVKPK